MRFNSNTLPRDLKMSIISFDTDDLAEFLLDKGIPGDIVLVFTGKC